MNGAGAMDACDALVEGAGPAGISAALRLQQLGYRVIIVERSADWPRQQVGEALTPGVRDILELLEANDALDGVPHLSGQPSRVLWRAREPESVAHGGAALVDRARFDAALLALARRRGIEVLLPARVHALGGAAGAWRVDLECGGSGPRRVAARFILDASGRGGAPRQGTPPLAALWTELAEADLPRGLAEATHVEALPHGWLWGARLPGRRYRVMLVCDPGTARQVWPGLPPARLRAACAASVLFGAVAALPFPGAVQMCSATPRLAPDCWREGRLKLGDAAFSLDPVSSSGVEKAMRFSLQAAVAVHSLLGEPASAALVRTFFEQHLVDTCTRHAHWTAAFYRQAWCAGQPFWRARSAPGFASADEHAWPGLASRLRRASEQLQRFRQPALRPLAELTPQRAVRLHAEASVIALPCVIDNRVQVHGALVHPNLERPLAFLDNEALSPHLDRLRQAQTLDKVLQQFGASMPAPKARALTAWLWQHGILDTVE
jgi:2-polyprenyl-6-methoxyphenol hydroxylase-like FAD-dependent oxidoreductase